MMIHGENTTQINGFDGYFITATGKVYSTFFGRIRRIAERVQRDGYIQVKIVSSKKQYTKSLHQLVAIAFIPNPCNKLQVNHIDGDKTNNNADNLEWVTPRENISHAIKHNLIRGHAGGKKLSDFDIMEIRYLGNNVKMRYKELAALYGISVGYLSGILRGVRRKSVWCRL